MTSDRVALELEVLNKSLQAGLKAIADCDWLLEAEDNTAITVFQDLVTMIHKQLRDLKESN